MKTRIVVLSTFAVVLTAVVMVYINLWQRPDAVTQASKVHPPILMDAQKSEEVNQVAKNRSWTPEEAQEHQRFLRAKMPAATESQRAAIAKSALSKVAAGSETFANGAIQGTWRQRGPYNQPGAWQFSEMDEGVDTVYGVTCGHYGGTQFIFKGTLKGDDFRLISGNFPNRYHDLIVIPHTNGRRIIAGIENGAIAYSDNCGQSWSFATGVSAVMHSTIINRQDNNVVYATDQQKVYVSRDHATSFTVLKDFGSRAGACRLYTPRYTSQPGSANVYLARDGSFYKLNEAKSDFTLRGSVTWPGNSNQFSLGGDSRRLYLTSGGKYWTSADEGATWQTRSPTFWDPTWQVTNTMSAGHYLGVNPENPDIVVGGYMDPVFSWNNLQTAIIRQVWAAHQVGAPADPTLRHRHKLHADNQSIQFFYDSKGRLLTIHNSDQGLYVSYNEWRNQAIQTTGDYPDTIYNNINLLSPSSSEIYPSGIACGRRNLDHILTGTQDGGTQTVENPGTAILSLRQGPYGDGPPYISYDGRPRHLQPVTSPQKPQPQGAASKPHPAPSPWLGKSNCLSA